MNTASWKHEIIIALDRIPDTQESNKLLQRVWKLIINYIMK